MELGTLVRRLDEQSARIKELENQLKANGYDIKEQESSRNCEDCIEEQLDQHENYARKLEWRIKELEALNKKCAAEWLTQEYRIKKLERELKFKDEMIASINIHGPALEQEIKELKEQLRNGGK